MDLYPGQSAPTLAEDITGEGKPRYGMFRRRDTGALHLLPLNGPYLQKKDARGKPLFVLTKDAPVRDDDVVEFVHDVQHADRLAAKAKK